MRAYINAKPVMAFKPSATVEVEGGYSVQFPPAMDFEQAAALATLFAASTSLRDTLRTVLPYAESRAEDMLEADGEQDGCDPGPETQKAVAAVDAAKALLASLDAEGAARG